MQYKEELKNIKSFPAMEEVAPKVVNSITGTLPVEIK